VFKVDLATPAYSILYRFAGDNIDGTTPQYANLLWDGVSILYGTASAGGAPSFGAVYALTLP
jgi:uncharacterized repeat protein (TIGR03803 family)